MIISGHRYLWEENDALYNKWFKYFIWHKYNNSLVGIIQYNHISKKHISNTLTGLWRQTRGCAMSITPGAMIAIMLFNPIRICITPVFDTTSTPDIPYCSKLLSYIFPARSEKATQAKY